MKEKYKEIIYWILISVCIIFVFFEVLGIISVFYEAYKSGGGGYEIGSVLGSNFWEIIFIYFAIKGIIYFSNKIKNPKEDLKKAPKL